VSRAGRCPGPGEGWVGWVGWGVAVPGGDTGCGERAATRMKEVLWGCRRRLLPIVPEGAASRRPAAASNTEPMAGVPLIRRSLAGSSRPFAVPKQGPSSVNGCSGCNFALFIGFIRRPELVFEARLRNFQLRGIILTHIVFVFPTAHFWDQLDDHCNELRSHSLQSGGANFC